jgi:serine protease Do
VIGPIVAVVCLVWGQPAAIAQSALPAAIERPARLTADKRAELYRQLRSQAEFLEKQAAVLKTVSKLLGPSVVHIEADASRRPALRVGGNNRRVEENGSGVIVELAGNSYVLTNRHVLAGAPPSRIKVNLADGRRIYPQRLWEDAETDVALLAVSAPELTPAPVGNSDAVEMGDFVLAMGCPFGLAHSVTFGVISGKGRRNLELGDSGIRLQDFLQTDAAINPGNSGGPLVNLRGEVIGINTCIASSSGGNEGVAFAIPSSMFMHVARQLVEHGRVPRSFMGVTLDADFGPGLAAEIGLPRAVGARVVQVAEGSPAAAAKVQEGDVILLYNGVAVENDGHLMNMVSMTPSGRTVPVAVFRDGRTITVQVTVVERPK